MSRELSLEVNKLCNFSCSFCYTEKYKEDLPPIEQVLALIDEGISIGVRSISMTGGEPLLQWERVAAIATHAKRHSLRTRLNTNGYFLVPSTKTTELSDLIDEFQVSFNAIGDEQYAGYAGLKATHRPYSRVLSNVTHLLEQSRSVTIRFTLDHDTAPYLASVFQLFCLGDSRIRGMRVGKFKVRVAVPAADRFRGDSTATVEIKAAASEFFSLAEKNTDVAIQFKDGSGLIRIPERLPHLSAPACICGAGSIHVSADLRRVTPCVFVRERIENSLGELRSGAQQLRDIWAQPAAIGFLGNDSEGASCASHSIWQSQSSCSSPTSEIAWPNVVKVSLPRSHSKTRTLAGQGVDREISATCLDNTVTDK